jgi:hypothetical protein
VALNSEKIKKRLYIYGAVASIISLLAYILEKTDILALPSGLEFVNSHIYMTVFWIGLTVFLTLFTVAILINRFTRDDPYDFLEVAFSLEILDGKGELAVFSRRRIMRPRKGNISTLSNGLHFADGSIENPTTKLWEVAKFKGGYKKIKELDLNANFSNFADPDRRAKLYAFNTLAPLHKRKLYLHIVKYNISNGFKEDQEYYNLFVARNTKKVTFELSPHKDRPIKENTVKVVKVKSKGVENPKLISNDGIRFVEGKLLWEIDHPSIGDEYRIIWSW